MTSEEIAELVGGSHFGAPVEVFAVNSLDQAGPEELAYAEKEVRGNAGLILCKHPVDGRTCVVVFDPKAAFLRILEHAFSERHFDGVHPSAVIEGFVADDVAIGAHVVIGEGSRIEKGAVIYPGVVIGRKCTIGAHSVLFPNVVLYDNVQIGTHCRLHAGAVIGADGFSYHPTDFGAQKAIHVGNVEIGDHVEIGANTCVDRAFLNSTTIGSYTKIDNLVQIGHNAALGEHNLLAGQVGVAGSARTGDHVTLAGKVGVIDHIEIGEEIQVGVGALVLKNLTKKGQYIGTPAVEAGIGRRAMVLWPRLPEIWKRLNALSDGKDSK